MSATISYLAIYPKFKAFSPSTGLPLAGGLLTTYVAGTTTPQATFADAGLLSPNSNPIILDANGEAVIYTPSVPYKFALSDALGNPLWTVDNYMPGGTPTSIVQAKLTADITGPFASRTQITTFTDLRDTNNEFASGIYTAKNSGYYDIEFSTLSKDSAAGQPQVCYININGTDVMVGVCSTIVAATQIRTTALLKGQFLNAGDAVRFYFLGTVNTSLLATTGLGTIQTMVAVNRIA